MRQRFAPLDAAILIPFIIFTLIWGSTWIVIKDQLGSVPPQWSVAYRFVIAAAAMMLLASLKGERMPLDRKSLLTVTFLGVTQFAVNFNVVYFAELHITSGVVATVFALLLIPSTLLAWAFLGHRPTRRFIVSSAVAIAGIGLLFLNEIRANPTGAEQILAGIGLTVIGMLAASSANVFQARPKVRRYPLFAMLGWSMVAGAVVNLLFAVAVAGPPVFDNRMGYWFGLLYLALPASVLTFSLYYPVVRKIGPAKAAYSSVLVPIIAMGFSTWLEDYPWTPLAIAGALLALGGMVGALSRPRAVVAAPDAG